MESLSTTLPKMMDVVGCSSSYESYNITDTTEDSSSPSQDITILDEEDEEEEEQVEVGTKRGIKSGF